MSPSDPFDDDFDDFFNDPEALESLAAIEEKAIAATQAPRPKHHHTVVRPAAGPRAGPQPQRQPQPAAAPAPRPLNTNPRVTGCGFGWESGGKHDVRYQQAQALPEPPPQPKKEALFLPAPDSYGYDDEPLDVTVDTNGQYGCSGTAAPPPPTLPPVAKPLQRTRSISTEPRGAPLPGSQARREAIEAARNSPAPVPGERGPLARSTSATSAGGLSTSKPQIKLSGTRMLARSVSTGQQVFAGRATSRPPVLAPISSQGSASGSQGPGAVARRAAVELDEERRLRAEAEREIRELRARLEANILPEGSDVAQLRQDLFVATGQAKMVRENAKISEDRFKEEIKRLKETNQDLEQRMKDKEVESKQKVESMRTQAVFSNHNALASASKARQQSQFFASQRQTPMKMGSPLRNKTAMTPAPLMQSATSKRIAPPPPRFDGLTNAFAMTPTVRKRPRPDATSPTTTPKKQRSGSGAASPMLVSPLGSPHRSQHDSQQQAEFDVGMDWQPDFGEPPLPQIVPDVPRDHKAELVLNIMTHITESPLLHTDSDDRHEAVSTLVRIARNPVPPLENLKPWDVLAQTLLVVSSSPNFDFTETGQEMIAIFADMLIPVRSWNQSNGVVPSWLFHAVYVLRLAASSILLFPSLVGSNLAAARDIATSLHVLSRVLPALGDNTTAAVEIADALVELSEALCLADAKRIWVADQLSVILLNLLSNEQPAVVARGLDLFAVASCYQDNFQPILFPSDGASDAPVIDRVARFLSSSRSKFAPHQYARSSLAALGALFTLTSHDPDAIVLLTGHSALIPCLLLLLHRESTRLWGVRVHATSGPYPPLKLLLPALVLLHHLVYPAPAQKAHVQASQARGGEHGGSDPEAGLFAGAAPQGVDLRRRLHETGSTKEFNGIQHVFVTALGAIAYADVDVEMDAFGDGGGGLEGGQRKGDVAGDLRTVQYLAQDLLDGVVEGPEGDQVYELYATEADGDAEAGADGAEGAPAGATQADAIVIDDDEEEYGDEEELMLGGGADDWQTPFE